MIKGAGGTSGGIGMFILGLVLAGIGFYMFFSRVVVEFHAWRLWGFDGTGAILVLFVIGVAILFFNGRSLAGWIITSASLAGLLIYLVLNLNFHFLATNLIAVLIMLGLIGAGIGLITRSFHGSVAEREETGSSDSR